MCVCVCMKSIKFYRFLCISNQWHVRLQFQKEILILSFTNLSLTVTFSRYKMRESKPFEAMLGGCIPILASIATIGLVSATGLAFQSIIVSTLFLILAIGWLIIQLGISSFIIIFRHWWCVSNAVRVAQKWKKPPHSRKSWRNGEGKKLADLPTLFWCEKSCLSLAFPEDFLFYQ